MPTTTKFSFSTTALYLINDVAKYGSIKTDILARWESMQNIMQLIKTSTNDDLRTKLPAMLNKDIAQFDISTPSWIASTVTFGWVSVSCRYATYLREMLTEFNKTQELDLFDKSKGGPVADPQVTPISTSTPAPTNVQSPQPLLPTAPSYSHAVTQAISVVMTTPPVQPAITPAITRTDELLNAYRQQVVKNMATDEVSKTLDSDSAAAEKTGAVSPTYYNRYTAWQLLNITYIEKTFGVDLEVDNIKKNISYINNLIIAFRPYFVRKDSSAAINLSLPECYDDLDKDLKSIKDSVLKNPSSRDALTRKLIDTCDKFKVMIKETIEALDASKTPRTFNPELINAFVDAIYRMINTAKKFKPMALLSETVVPPAAEVTPARVGVAPR